MSDWESRRKSSPFYYLCLLLLLWPILFVPIYTILAVQFMSLNALLTALSISTIFIGLIYGCGTNYRYRGINPPSRNIINYGDNKYAETYGLDASDNP